MKGNIEERCVSLGQFIIEKGATVRSAAKQFDISKSTVHKDVTERLKAINQTLYNDVKKVLDENRAQRHMRGGLATREKYKELKKAAK